MSRTNKFIHFGCWNNLNKPREDGKTDMEDVMTMMNKRIKVDPVDFIVVAGDNYYPSKKNNKNISKDKQIEDKQKFILDDKLAKGFQRLQQVHPTLEINMLLGNHDLQTNSRNEEKAGPLFITTNGVQKSEAGDCHILKKEIEESEKIDLVLNKAKMLDHGTLLLMLDSSIYTPDKTAALYLPCYAVILGEHVPDVNTLRDKQAAFVLDSIRRHKENLKHVIIIGHHPITGIKIKNKEKVFLNDIPVFAELLRKIHTEVNDPTVKYFYLCADLHLYQKGIVTIKTDTHDDMVIHQYIVGTGGTELDDPLPPDSEKKKERSPLKGIEYELVISSNAFGYLECDVKEMPTFQFIGVGKTKKYNGGGSRRRKTNKKRKWNSRKRNSRKRNSRVLYSVEYTG